MGFSKTPRALKARIRNINKALADEYPDAECELDIKGALQTLISTILSAQCTDVKVNQTTPALFKRFKTAKDYANATPEEIEPIIRSLGLYKAKAANIIKCCRQIMDGFGGKVPDNMADLTKLAGVGRKTASCVLVNAYGKPGLMTDTHFCRITGRLGLTSEKQPEKIEQDIARILPESEWGDFSHRIIIHGRRCCTARKPACERCALGKLCEFPHTKAQVKGGS